MVFPLSSTRCPLRGSTRDGVDHVTGLMLSVVPIPSPITIEEFINMATSCGPLDLVVAPQTLTFLYKIHIFPVEIKVFISVQSMVLLTRY